jgi:hypothetical protein
LELERRRARDAVRRGDEDSIDQAAHDYEASATGKIDVDARNVAFETSRSRETTNKELGVAKACSKLT